MSFKIYMKIALSRIPGARNSFLSVLTEIWDLRFESSVIFEGSKTCRTAYFNGNMFESSVIFEGSKTAIYYSTRA